MIGDPALREAVEGHWERTSAGPETLLGQLGVEHDELIGAIVALTRVRLRDPELRDAAPETIYNAAALDGFVIGVRAARAELDNEPPPAPAPSLTTNPRLRPRRA